MSVRSYRQRINQAHNLFLLTSDIVIEKASLTRSYNSLIELKPEIFLIASLCESLQLNSILDMLDALTEDRSFKNSSFAFQRQLHAQQRVTRSEFDSKLGSYLKDHDT